MKEIILINITGKDKTGLTASLTNILAQYEVTILDIGQAVIHDYLPSASWWKSHPPINLHRSLKISCFKPTDWASRFAFPPSMKPVTQHGLRNMAANAESSPCWVAG